MPSSGPLTFQVEASDAGTRLDLFIANRLPECSRSYSAKLIHEGHVKVCAARKKPGYRLRIGERVTAVVPEPQPLSTMVPEPLDFQIIYQDEDIAVVNKPSGLVVHPAPGHTQGTLVHGLLHHCPDIAGIGGEMRPGIVHRLDRDTSGLLVAAKTDAAHNHLSRQFKARSVDKCYLALVDGAPTQTSGKIEMPIGRHPRDRKRMSARASRGREARTDWQVGAYLKGATLIRLKLRTGRTHQIRVHCAAIGHPVIGDPVYGRRRPSCQSRRVAAIIAQAPRQMLHAWRIAFLHPKTERPLRFEAALPKDMTILLKQLLPQTSDMAASLAFLGDTAFLASSES